MKTLFLILFFALVNRNVFSQKNDENGFIYWNDTVKLVWADFSGIPDSNVNHKALTTTSIAYNITSSNNIIEFKLESVFIKEKSWVKCDTTYILLLHEQIHFDIAELFTRKIRVKLLAQVFSRENYQNKFLTLYYDLYKEMREFQQLYDKETDHSRNIQKQEEWNKLINEELEKYKEYKEPIIEVYLSK